MKKKIGIFVGCLSFLLFLVPFFYGYQNFGGVLGCVISLLFILYVLYKKKLKNGNNIGKIILKTIETGAFILLFMYLASLLYMMMGQKKIDNQERTVIVLGCEVKEDGTPSALLKDRLDGAISYLIQYPNTKIIVGGGKTSVGPVEAEVSKTYLVKQGINENQIYVDGNSYSTYENIVNAKRIIEDKSLNPKVVLMTSWFHQARAIFCANLLSLDAVSYPCEVPWWLVPTYTLREMIAQVNYLLTYTMHA